MPFPIPEARRVRGPKVQYDPSQMRHRAYKFAGKGLSKQWVVRKLNQRLEEFATEWECQYSQCIYAGKGTRVHHKQLFWPVVDSNLMLVGHMGTVSGRGVVCPSDAFFVVGSIDRNLEEDIPVFVGREKEGWAPLGSSEEIYTVVAGIDGEVLCCLATDYVGIESVDFWPLDVLELCTGVVGLGAVLTRKVARALAKRAAKRTGRKLLKGPTLELAEATVQRQVAKGLTKPQHIDFIPDAGMTTTHFQAFKAAAQEKQLIAVVRNTNVNSTRLIEQGCPGKPLHFKFNTDSRTGILIAKDPADIHMAHSHGYFVVGKDGVARRTVSKGGQIKLESLEIDDQFWKLAEGQVIDPKLKKPVVGDYDLMGIIDPKSPGQNISLAARSGRRVQNVSNPVVDDFAKSVNDKMDMDRVLHGAQDQFGDFRKGAIAFFPDGRVHFMRDEESVEAFYKLLGRETAKGSYPRPTGDVVDELAARRARKAK